MTKRKSDKSLVNGFFTGTQKAGTYGANINIGSSLVFKLEYSIINPNGKGLFASEISKDKVKSLGASIGMMF